MPEKQGIGWRTDLSRSCAQCGHKIHRWNCPMLWKRAAIMLPLLIAFIVLLVISANR
jgi:hypothetical protein